jgi:uncharacterized protein (TIGR02453 family)
MNSFMTHIAPTSFEFLKKLKKNNNREWFNAHKDIYQRELLSVEQLVDVMIGKLRKFDRIDVPSGKKAMMRIYRDIRFSSDKSPYKTHWSGGFQREGKQLRGGYYFQFAPGASFVAGGFWGPVPRDLKLIRDEFAFDDKPIRKILSSQKIVNEFGTLMGEQLKTVPRGYDKDHPAADLLRYKQFILQRNFTDKEIFSKDFAEKAVLTMRCFKPFFDYMSEVLVVPG